MCRSSGMNTSRLNVSWADMPSYPRVAAGLTDPHGKARTFEGCAIRICTARLHGCLRNLNQMRRRSLFNPSLCFLLDPLLCFNPLEPAVLTPSPLYPQEPAFLTPTAAFKPPPFPRVLQKLFSSRTHFLQNPFPTPHPFLTPST